MSEQEFRLEFPFRIKMVNASPDVDSDFGPYESVEDANEKIEPTLRVEGKIVGIYQDDKLTLYAYQGGIADEDLTPLIAGGGELKKIGDGYGLQHQIDNPDNYGTLGSNAVNFSFSQVAGNYGATGYASHAEGSTTIASGPVSHAEGVGTTASGYYSHAEGYNTIASGMYSHAEGYNTEASGRQSHAEGEGTTASGNNSHAEGWSTTASGHYSHAEGQTTKASGWHSHAEGWSTEASGRRSHAEGSNTIAASFAENARGIYNEEITPISTGAFNSNDVIESVGVGDSEATRKNALTRWKNGAFKWLLQPLTNITNAVLGFHAADENGRLNYHDGAEWKKYLIEGEGGGGEVDLSDYYNKQEVDGLLEGKEDVSNKKTEVEDNKASNTFYPSIKAVYDWAVSKFLGLRLENLASDLDETEQDEIKTKLNISDGGELKKIGNGYGLQHQIDNPTRYGTLGENAVNLSYSINLGNFGATGYYSHAEGFNTTASNYRSHAEGNNTTASGQDSHAEGSNTTASGWYSHSEGFSTTASGMGSHAEGQYTIASGGRSHAEGSYTTAGSFAENARGAYNEVIPPISTNAFNSNDVIESVGVGTSSERKNALTRWKNGAFKWLLQPLTNITNAVIGFHAADEDGRLNYHDGAEWKKYALEGNGVTPTVTASVVTSYDIDPQTETEHWNLAMTGDTDFDFTNMFASGNSKVITITLEGDFAFTFPSWLKPLETNDDYDTMGGTLVAEIVINIKNGGTNPRGYYSLQMIDYAL